MFPPKQEDDDGDVMAGDRRLSRPDTALPDWHIPDVSYRPIPFTWFTAAFLVQYVASFAIFMLFIQTSGLAVIVLSTFVTLVIGKKTWDRGMKHANLAWKVATIAMLTVQLAFIAIGASDRL